MRPTLAKLKFALIDGPNMSNLRTGGRDRRTYGAIESIETLHSWLTASAAEIGIELETFVSNHEGEIIEYVHSKSDFIDAFLVNPAGLNLQSHALNEALIESNRPIIELHFANIAALGYPTTVFTQGATAMVMGLRQYGYLASLVAVALALNERALTPPMTGPRHETDRIHQ